MKKIHKFKCNNLVAGVASAVALFASSELYAADSETLYIDIESQSIGQAVRALAKNAGVQIIMSSELRDKFKVSSLRGSYTLKAALDELIAGSGLKYEFLADNSVVINEGETGKKENSDQESLEELVVTGSRLKNSNVAPSSPVTTIDRITIEKRGFTSVEEIIRSLPQNFTGYSSGGHVDASNPGPRRENEGGASADLRGLGAGSTLILVNGKRIAAAPARSGTFTDVSTIPFAAIERVEILSDGGGAIYGADAVAGVINIILKKDYQGAETALRMENSSTGGDSYTLEQSLGASWETGNMTASLSYQKNHAANADKAGLDTMDLRVRGGRDWRSAQYGRPGVIQRANWLSGAPAWAYVGVLPSGDGVGLTASDITFIPYADVVNQTGSYDALAGALSDGLAAKTVTPEGNQVSGSLSLSQDISDSVSANLSGYYSERKSTTALNSPVERITVPESNAYNNFGEAVTVGYAFEDAQGLGVLTKTRRFGINGGLQFELPFRDWGMNVDFGYGEDRSASPWTYLDVGSDAFQTALASDSPDTALNLFGDGSVQPIDVNSMIVSGEPVDKTTTLKSLELGGNGSLVDLPAGSVTMAVGGEYRIDDLDVSDVNSSLDTRWADTVPERTLKAAYVEFAVPVVSAENAMPGIQELSFTLAGRYEKYTVEADSSDIGGKYSEFVPKLGVSWYPVDDLKLRATWGEGFQSPTLIEMFEPLTVWNFPYFDPVNPADWPWIDYGYGGNPNLKAQTSETTTIGFDYTPEFLPGLTASVSWVKTEMEDVIGLLAAVAGDEYLLTNSDLFPGVVTRDDNGVLTGINLIPTNFASRVSEAVDFDLRYNFDSELGAWAIGVLGSYTAELTEVAVPGVVAVQKDGTENGPDRWKVQSFVEWELDDWSANLFVNHSSSYSRDPLSQSTQARVEGYTTLDLQIGYEMQDNQITYAVGVKNLLDADFPFIDKTIGADARRVNFRGRIAYLNVKKIFDF